jgi:hypothetical protein
MDKRYQVFVSSTFTDLQEERRKVIQTIMELDCFPAGMELFPAADEEQWAFIRRVIDDCDYYLLLVGGRYGSLTEEGISYTEKEYDYAVERGIRVLAFLHEKPEEIPAARSELRPEARDKLDAFRAKVSQGRLVRFWSNADALPGLVALSLTKTIKTYPALGWARATGTLSTETLTELNDLRKRIAELETQLAEEKESTNRSLVDLAPLDAAITVNGTYKYGAITREWSKQLTWKELFDIIGPTLLLATNDTIVRSQLTEFLGPRIQGSYAHEIRKVDFDTIKVQLLAHKLISVRASETKGGGVGLFWKLTAHGETVLIETRSVRLSEQLQAAEDSE